MRREHAAAGRSGGLTWTKHVSNPNILSFFYSGESVKPTLPFFFFSELQSRYGSTFFVRENGTAEPVRRAVEAIDECLRKGGCAVVPGLDADTRNLTLWPSIAGGLLAGFGLRAQMRECAFVECAVPVWGARTEGLTGPLGAVPYFAIPSFILTYALGILPITSRTDDVLPVATNLFWFTAVALLLALTPAVGSLNGFGSGDGEGGGSESD